MAITRRPPEADHLPPIEQNQFVSRSTAAEQLSTEHGDNEEKQDESAEAEQESNEEQQTSQCEETESNNDTSHTSDNEIMETKTNEKSAKTSEEQQVSNEDSQIVEEEATNETDTTDTTDDRNSETQEQSSNRPKIKKLNQVNISRKTASDEQEDPLITQLDKKIDRELRMLQGNSNDGDEDDVEADTLIDLLHGQRAKEIDEFLKT